MDWLILYFLQSNTCTTTDREWEFSTVASIGFCAQLFFWCFVDRHKLLILLLLLSWNSSGIHSTHPDLTSTELQKQENNGAFLSRSPKWAFGLFSLKKLRWLLSLRELRWFMLLVKLRNYKKKLVLKWVQLRCLRLVLESILIYKMQWNCGFSVYISFVYKTKWVQETPDSLDLA